MKMILKNVGLLCFGLWLTAFLITPAQAETKEVENLRAGLSASAGTAGLDTTTNLTTAIGRPIGYLFGIIGVVILVVVLLGGALWMTAGGSEEKVNKAKQLIGNGINGLIVLFFAYALVYAVIAALGYATSK